MKQSYFALSFFCLFPFLKNGFSQTTITGYVKDASGSLPYVNVLILQPADSSLVKGAVSADNGTFVIENVGGGDYLLSVYMVGYAAHYQEVGIPSTGTFAVGEIELSEETAQLETVQVTAKKPLFEQKIDRLTVNVASSITAAGATALEVLERSPGVIVNRQQNAISVAGKDGVIVMMNGKINRMPLSAVVQLLEGMPSSNIEKIEIITTPPANFDAEGNAGFINIVLKQTTDRGLNGSYSFSAGYGRGDVSSAGINFNYRKNKVNLYGDYSFSREAQDQLFEVSRLVGIDGQPNLTETRSERNPVQRNHNTRVGIDLDLGKKTVLGLLLSGYDNRWSMDALNISSLTVGGQLDSLINIVNDEVNHWKHLGGNFNLQHTFAEGEIVTFDMDYLRYDNENPTNYLNSYFDENNVFLFEEQTFSGKATPIKVGVAKLDYTKSFSEKLKMETGIKGTVSRFDNNVTVSTFENNQWVNDPSLTADYRLEESIGAVYSSFDVKLDEKSNVKFGLRYEYTNSNLGTPEQPDIVDRQFGKLFPSFFLSRNFSEEQSANLSYSRRITRPTFNELAPFVIFFDPNTFISGNAALQPAISDNVKLDYRYKTALFSLQYTHEDSAIVRFQNRTIPGTNKLLMVSDNMKNRRTASFTVAFPVEVAKWWRMQNNLIGSWQEVNGYFNYELLQFRTTNYSITWINMFTLPKNFSAEMVGFYNSKGLFGTSVFLPIGGMNIGFQKKFKNDNGSLRFGIDDIFNSIKMRSETDLPEQNLQSEGSFDFSQRTYKLSYSRSFGNKKLKSQRQRATGSEEERRRVN